MDAQALDGLLSLVLVVALGVALYYAVRALDEHMDRQHQRRMNDRVFDTMTEHMDMGGSVSVVGDHMVTYWPGGRAECTCGLWFTSEDVADAHLQSIAYNRDKWKRSYPVKPEWWDDPTEPRCDECGVHTEDAEGDWCGECGMCADHCLRYAGCTVALDREWAALQRAIDDEHAEGRDVS